MAALKLLHLVGNLLSPIFFPVATTVILQHCSYQMLLSRIQEIINVLVVTRWVILVPVCPLWLCLVRYIGIRIYNWFLFFFFSVPPTVSLTGPQIPPNEGELLTLICTVTNSFPGLSISWLKDNEPLASGRRVEISTATPVQNPTTLLYTTTSNLKIQQVGLEDEGIYTCRTNTILSSISVSFNFTVQSKSMV